MVLVCVGKIVPRPFYFLLPIYLSFHSNRQLKLSIASSQSLLHINKSETVTIPSYCPFIIFMKEIQGIYWTPSFIACNQNNLNNKCIYYLCHLVQCLYMYIFSAIKKFQKTLSVFIFFLMLILKYIYHFCTSSS